MKHGRTIVLTALLIALPSTAWASTDATLRDDRRTYCQSETQDWVDLKVVRNDDVPDGTKITDFGQPSHGKARLVIDDGYNQLQYRNVTPNDSYWAYYEVHLPNGNVKNAFWRVTVDARC